MPIAIFAQLNGFLDLSLKKFIGEFVFGMPVIKTHSDLTLGIIKPISNEEIFEELQDQISEFPSDLLADSLIMAAIQIIQLNTKIEEIKSVIKKH